MIRTSVRTATLLLTLATLLGTATAQENKVRVKVKSEPTSGAIKGAGVSKAVYGDPGSFVALTTKDGQTVLGGLMEEDLDWQLQVFTTDKLMEVKRDRPRFVWGIGPLALETIETFNKQFRVILSKPDPEHGQLLLLQQELSPRSLTGRAAELITAIPYDLLGRGSNYYKPGMTVGFQTIVADNDQHMLIALSPTTTTHKAGSPTLGLMVDKDMNPLWFDQLSTNPGNVRTEIMNTLVDKNGAAWYLIKNVTDATPRSPETVGYNFTLHRMDGEGQTIFPLELTKKEYVQDAGLAILPNGNLACAGIYSTVEANRDEAVGVFRMVLDPAKGEWSTTARHPFNLRLVDKVERLQKGMHLERIWAKSDGGLFVVTWQADRESHQVSKLSGEKVDKWEWTGGTFHVMELDASGQQKWYTELVRDLVFEEEGPELGYSTTYGDLLFLFYNDHANNIEPRKRKQPVSKVTKVRDAMMAEFRTDGGFKERTVLTQGFFAPDDMWPLADGLVGVRGTFDFKKGSTFPILIETTDGSRR